MDTSEKQEILSAIREGDESVKREVLKAVAQVDSKVGELDQQVRDNGVLLEHMDSKISAVAEQHTSINRRLDSHGEMLANVAEDVTMLKDDVVVLSGKVDRIDGRLAALEPQPA